MKEVLIGKQKLYKLVGESNALYFSKKLISHQTELQ